MQNNVYGEELDLKIDKFKSKMKEAQTISKETGKKIAENTKYGVWKDGIYTLSNGMQFVRKEEKQLNNEIEETGKVSQNTGNEISKAFNKGLKSVKRLTLGFLGARSAFGLFKKYMSEYSSQNEEFNQKMQLTTNVITTALAPAFEFFGNVIQYAVIGLARIIELLTGVNILGKTIDTSFKGASKSAKEFNDNLSGLDEISNIDQSASGLSTGISSQLEALNDFKKKVEEVKELFKKWGVEEKINTIKTFLKELWNSQVMQGVKKLIGNIVDWSIKHPNAVATILGGMALVTLIRKIMGSTGGTGLLGLVSNVKYLAGLGAIGLTIAIAYKGKEELEKWYNNTVDDMNKNTDKMTKKVKTAGEKINKAIESNDKESVQKLFDNKLKSQDQLMKNLEKLQSLTGGIGGLNSISSKSLDWLTGRKGSEEALKDIEKIKTNTKELMEQTRQLYETGMLNSKQEDVYKRLIEQQLIYSKAIGYSKTEMNNLVKEYMNMDSSSQSINKMVGYMKNLGFTQEEITTTIKPYFDSIASGTANAVNQAKNTKSEISNIFSVPITMKFSADTSSILGSVSSAIGSIKNAFSKIGLSVPSYDVGTDYVPRDQLAMVHEGERIVPKKYNNSQYMGNDETNSLLIELNRNVLELANKPSILNVNGKELAKATYSDYQEEGSRRGSNMSIRRV